MTYAQRAVVARYRRANPRIEAVDWVKVGQGIARSLDRFEFALDWHRTDKMAELLKQHAHRLLAPIKNPVRRKRAAAGMYVSIQAAWRGLNIEEAR